MFYLDVPFMCIYALVSIINNTIQYKYHNYLCEISGIQLQFNLEIMKIFESNIVYISIIN